MIIIETGFQNVKDDFKVLKGKFAGIKPFSGQYWLWLQSDSVSNAPGYKVAVSGLAEAIFNYEMYQELYNLKYIEQPYSYVFLYKTLLFLIRYDGRVFNKDGNEMDVNLIAKVTDCLTQGMFTRENE